MSDSDSLFMVAVLINGNALQINQFFTKSVSVIAPFLSPTVDFFPAVFKSGRVFASGDKKTMESLVMNNKNHPAVIQSGREGTITKIQLTHSWLMEHIKNFVKTENITPQQYYILRILRSETRPLSTNQIRERMIDKMSDTSRIVERLENKGLVKKEVSAKDKRMVDVVITPDGMNLLEQLDRRNEELDNILNHLSDVETETLNSLLDKLRNHQ